MIIKDNMIALNAYRQLSENNGPPSKKSAVGPADSEKTETQMKSFDTLALTESAVVSARYLMREASMGLQLPMLGDGVVDIAQLTGSSFTLNGAVYELRSGGAATGSGTRENPYVIDISGCVTAANVTAKLNAGIVPIRDAGMAKEMMSYTANNILLQSAQSMFAQANMAPQSVAKLIA